MRSAYVYSSRTSFETLRPSTRETTHAHTPTTKQSRPICPNMRGTTFVRTRLRAALNSATGFGTTTPISDVPSSWLSVISLSQRGIIFEMDCCSVKIEHANPVRTRISVEPSCVKVALASSACGSMDLQALKTLSTTAEAILLGL